jgi:hypothetical protein
VTVAAMEGYRAMLSRPESPGRSVEKPSCVVRRLGLRGLGSGAARGRESSWRGGGAPGSSRGRKLTAKGRRPSASCGLLKQKTWYEGVISAVCVVGGDKSRAEGGRVSEASDGSAQEQVQVPTDLRTTPLVCAMSSAGVPTANAHCATTAPLHHLMAAKIRAGC